MAEGDVRELTLHYSNTERLYTNRYTAWVTNFQRRMEKGTFVKDQAVGGVERNFVPEIQKDYNKEYPDSQIHLSKSEKTALAKDITNSGIEDAKFNIKENNFALKSTKKINVPKKYWT